MKYLIILLALGISGSSFAEPVKVTLHEVVLDHEENVWGTSRTTTGDDAIAHAKSKVQSKCTDLSGTTSKMNCKIEQALSGSIYYWAASCITICEFNP